MQRPTNSRVQLECRMTTPSIRRSHPANFVQRIEGKVLAYPVVLKAFPLLPKCLWKPKTVGRFAFHLIHVGQSRLSDFWFHQILEHASSDVKVLFGSAPDYDSCFRSDLPLEPSDVVLVLDKFKIHRSHHHDQLIMDCIEELVRLFVYHDVIIIRRGVIDDKLLMDMGFALITETSFLLRDNELHRITMLGEEISQGS